MTFTYDPEADSLYISLRDGAFAESIPLDEERTVDVDAEQNVLGIEIGAASAGVRLLDLVGRFRLEAFQAILGDIERTSFHAAARA